MRSAHLRGLWRRFPFTLGTVIFRLILLQDVYNLSLCRRASSSRIGSSLASCNVLKNQSFRVIVTPMSRYTTPNRVNVLAHFILYYVSIMIWYKLSYFVTLPLYLSLLTRKLFETQNLTLCRVGELEHQTLCNVQLLLGNLI